ncbi:MAG: methyltransferase [Flavobacteriales bacterium]|nr:methyltransferase [Flavobacteriales bacterium]MCB9197808.1 methyltransferase [Flavobacteriales bacterium]
MLQKLHDKYLQWNYLRRSRSIQDYSFKGLTIKILPGVFSPQGTRTTELFSDYLLDLDWKDKRVLELGAGSGIISFLLANKGAKITASDISENAINGLKENRTNLQLDIEIIKSDLFNDLSGSFELVLINPPFFNKKPTNDQEIAWYCGENFEFFHTLFEQFSKRPFSEEMWMILSKRARIDEIVQIIKEKNLKTSEIVDLNMKKEPHVILKISDKS